jgi:hypothetical protein
MVKYVDPLAYGITRNIERIHRRRRIALKKRDSHRGTKKVSKPRYNRNAHKSNWYEEAQEHLS